jgi:hypothetical protein
MMPKNRDSSGIYASLRLVPSASRQVDNAVPHVEMTKTTVVIGG